MKVKLNTITRKQWEAAKEAADLAIADIPLAHNRRRAETYSKTLSRELAKRSKLREIEPVGKQAIWDHDYNHGTRKYPFIVREFEETTIERQSKSGDMFMLRSTRGYTWNVTVIYR